MLQTLFIVLYSLRTLVSQKSNDVSKENQDDPLRKTDTRNRITTSKTFLEKRVSMEVDNNDAFVNVSNVGN